MLAGQLYESSDGLKGFDCNTVVTPRAASLFYQYKYRFAVRYVARTSHKNPQDLTEQEAEGILGAKLGLMVVQHVAKESETIGWIPTAQLGTDYGTVASADTQVAGVPSGCNVWLDLEGVMRGVAPEDIIAYCNNWHQVVSDSGYEPGLYVGFGCGLTSAQLYNNLRFTHYWGAYNLNKDRIPAVRGLQMKQASMKQIDTVIGVRYPFDVNICKADNLGGCCIHLGAEDWTPYVQEGE